MTPVAVAAFLVAAVGFLAAVPGALGTLGNGVDLLIPDREPPEAETVVDRFVSEVQTKMLWDRPPTIQEPSRVFMKEHFSDLDPRRSHPIGQSDQPTQVSIPDLVPRIPEFVGVPLLVSGRMVGRAQVTLYDATDGAPFGVDSSAFFLQEPGVKDVAVVCRVPLRAGPNQLRPLSRAGAPREFQVGEDLVAEGVLIADGSAPIAVGRKSIRVLYMACGSIGHVVRAPGSPE